jgi:hypothetical protein
MKYFWHICFSVYIYFYVYYIKHTLSFIFILIKVIEFVDLEGEMILIMKYEWNGILLVFVSDCMQVSVVSYRTKTR